MQISILKLNIFLYKPKPNIKENGILEFKDNYSKNKYITETKLIKKSQK